MCRFKQTGKPTRPLPRDRVYLAHPAHLYPKLAQVASGSVHFNFVFRLGFVPPKPSETKPQPATLVSYRVNPNFISSDRERQTDGLILRQGEEKEKRRHETGGDGTSILPWYVS